jgi:hypothetical protein
MHYTWLSTKLKVLALLSNISLFHGVYLETLNEWLLYCPYCHKKYNTAIDVCRHMFTEHKDKFRVG